jgi:hypothetical protein
MNYPSAYKETKEEPTLEAALVVQSYIPESYHCIITACNPDTEAHGITRTIAARNRTASTAGCPSTCTYRGNICVITATFRSAIARQCLQCERTVTCITTVCIDADRGAARPGTEVGGNRHLYDNVITLSARLRGRPVIVVLRRVTKAR